MLMSPPTTQAASTGAGAGTRAATVCGTTKMPAPMTLPMTSMVMSNRPSRGARAGASGAVGDGSGFTYSMRRLWGSLPKLLQHLLGMRIVRIQFQAFFIILDREFLLARLHVGLAKAVVGVGRFRKGQDAKLED